MEIKDSHTYFWNIPLNRKTVEKLNAILNS